MRVPDSERDSRDAKKVVKAAHELICPICSHDRFWSRRTQMNTAFATFFDLDWLNRSARNYVCDRFEALRPTS